MNKIVYEETLTGRPHDTSAQKATSDNEMWMQFNVMPRTRLILEVLLLNYLDDLTMGGPEEVNARDALKITDVGDSMSLHLNLSKCEL